MPQTPSRKYVYYAHAKGSYGTIQEAKDVIHINDTFIASDVMNPSCPYWEKWWRIYGMTFFDKKLLPHINTVVFRTYRTGKVGERVGAGVHHEVKAAYKLGLPVYQIKDNAYNGLYLDPVLEHVFDQIPALSRRFTSLANKVIMPYPEVAIP